jgi:hypothetical protein
MRRLVLLGLAVLLPASLGAQERTRSPHGDLKLECTACHRSDGWKEIRISRSFDHGKFGFPLTGAHGSATCRACHANLDFTGVKSDCASCHKDVHRGELGPDCARCHTSRDFQDRDAMLRMHQLTRFRLDGAHRAVDCSNCHTPAGQGQLQFVARSADCASCHEADFVAAKNPDHVASGIPRDCVNCHPTTTWSRGKFNHDATAFPLTGAHRAVACLQCHTNGGYQGLSNQCVQCHQNDYNTAASPDHRQAQFPTDCTPCHSTTAWSPATFNHSTTRFPLTGAHRATTCDQCHGDGVYVGKPTTCVPCHQTDYNNTTAPKHTPTSFPTTCTSCHTTTAWSPATFNHSATQFPLTGAHKTVTCAQCHGDGVYTGKPTTCVSCHQTDYDNTTNPKHTPSSFPTTCTTCHTTTAWTGATFTHSWFPRPHHGISDCADCHTNPNDYTVFACITCHTHNKTTTDGEHRGRSGYSYDSNACLRCHPRGSAD